MNRINKIGENMFNEIVKNVTDVNPYNEASTLLSNNMIVTEYFYN